MIAILLNSGIGSRMGALTQDSPKCIVEVLPGKTIISMQMDTLLACGIEHFVVTTGYMADELQRYLGERYPGADIRYVYNGRYRDTNYIVSLNNAASYTEDDVVLLHGDLVFSGRAARSMLAASGSAVAVDRALPIPEKDFKARLRPDGTVREIGVNVFGAGSVACQPFYRLNQSDWALWRQSIREFCAGGVETVYAENALNAVLDRMELRALDMGGELCMEIDNAEDLDYVRKSVG